MARNTALFQNTANTKNTRPPRLGAPLRYGPRPYLSAYAASLTLRRSGLNFLFLRYPGFHGSRLRCCAAPPRQVAVPPRAIIFRPFRGSKLGSLALANSNLASCMKSIENSFSIFVNNTNNRHNNGLQSRQCYRKRNICNISCIN